MSTHEAEIRDCLEKQLHIDPFSVRFLLIELDAVRAELADTRRTCAELVTDGNALTLAVSLQRKCLESEEAKMDVVRMEWLQRLDCDSPHWHALADSVDPRTVIDDAMEAGK